MQKKQDKPVILWKNIVKAGIAAGLISGLVKLGWENIAPPRTKEREKTNPPQQLLQQLGLPESFTHRTYRYSGHELPWVSYGVHFGFSISFATLYEALKRYEPEIRAGGGSVFGLAIWAAFHLGIMPAMKTIPSAQEQPVAEHMSEALGHMIWMWTNEVVGDAVYHQLSGDQPHD
ncbi:MAG: DUF1440 domain-containing protein [Sporolactobacillus sp.]